MPRAMRSSAGTLCGRSCCVIAAIDCSAATTYERVVQCSEPASAANLRSATGHQLYGQHIACRQGATYNRFVTLACWPCRCHPSNARVLGLACSCHLCRAAGTSAAATQARPVKCASAKWAMLLFHVTSSCVDALWSPRCDWLTMSVDLGCASQCCALDSAEIAAEAAASRQGGCCDIEKRSRCAPTVPPRHVSGLESEAIAQQQHR
jgi:hypothetical protein